MDERITTLIFDMDGVITSESKYWNTARLTVWDILTSEHYLGLANYFNEGNSFLEQLSQLGNNVISRDFIYELKRRAVNSNWDLTFFVLSLQLVGILDTLKQTQPDIWRNFLQFSGVSVQQDLKQLGNLLQAQTYDFTGSNAITQRFWEETAALTGNNVVEYLYAFSQSVLATEIAFLKPKGELWKLCYLNFQEWYEGKRNYSLPDDETVINVSCIQETLKVLSNQNKFILGIATGRPRSEVMQPLTALDLLQYFDPTRIATYDDVLQAEEFMAGSGINIRLAKPHPFVLLKAIHPQEDLEVLCSDAFQRQDRSYVAYLGDATSDVVAAKQSGCYSIGVLTGCVDGRAIDIQEQMLIKSGSDVVLSSVVGLPSLLGVSCD